MYHRYTIELWHRGNSVSRHRTFTCQDRLVTRNGVESLDFIMSMPDCVDV